MSTQETNAGTFYFEIPGCEGDAGIYNIAFRPATTFIGTDNPQEVRAIELIITDSNQQPLKISDLPNSPLGDTARKILSSLKDMGIDSHYVEGGRTSDGRSAIAAGNFLVYPTNMSEKSASKAVAETCKANAGETHEELLSRKVVAMRENDERIRDEIKNLFSDSGHTAPSDNIIAKIIEIVRSPSTSRGAKGR